MDTENKWMTDILGGSELVRHQEISPTHNGLNAVFNTFGAQLIMGN